MMKSILFTAAALAAVSAAEARVAPPLRTPEAMPLPAPRHVPPGVPNNCQITIVFGSYAAGIDGQTFARMDRALRQDRRVRRVTQHRWGREGEVTLCIYTRTYAGAVPLSRDLRRLIPARPRGPVSVNLFPNRVV